MLQAEELLISLYTIGVSFLLPEDPHCHWRDARPSGGVLFLPRIDSSNSYYSPLNQSSFRIQVLIPSSFRHQSDLFSRTGSMCAIVHVNWVLEYQS